ncbi:hypothetical protein ACFCXT_13625 [Streptomyces vinaceus]|uniref:hypothetical protein n=1 Tax=Streptomyces vinaceus TaxID=1960 RepID=UPI0035D9E45E
MSRPISRTASLAAQEAGASEAERRQIAAEALQERYSEDGGRRASDLIVELTDMD